MSDAAGTLDEDASPTDSGLKRAGRTRICKQCRFATTDVREFSNHRLHAHAEENADDKSGSRKNSLRRKSSANSNVAEEQQKSKDQSTENKTEKESASERSVSKEEKSGQISEDLNDSEVNKNEEMASEKISDELLNSLALAPAPKKQIKESKQETDLTFGDLKSADEVKHLKSEIMNGHYEEMQYDEDDELDDENRLIIADESENGADLSGSEPLGLCRSGNIQNRTYLCSNCEFSTTNAKSYLHHVRDTHNSSIIIYECDICDYATKYKQKLPRHRKLHFTGKDGFSESDLENSLTEREMKEMRENSNMALMDNTMGDDEMEEDGDMEEDEEEEMVALTGVPEDQQTALATEGAPVEKKKRVRQEVDPLKYFEVMDDSGVKYACSKCGNVYKWRKSLNKHWKEKHFGELPDLTCPPATLQNYTLYCRYKAKFGGQPPPPAAPNVVYGAAIPNPTSQPKNQSTPTAKQGDDIASHLSNVVMPREIGPFIGGTNSNMYNSSMAALSSQLARHGRTPENHHEMRQMIDGLQNKNRLEQMNRMAQKVGKAHQATMYAQQHAQSEPLDFSKPLDFSIKSEVKTERSWGDNTSESDSLQEMPVSLVVSQENKQNRQSRSESSEREQDAAVLQCNKCSFVAKTLVDYSAHMSLHLNKRAFKCAECQAHFNGVDDLNKHFQEAHSEKIQEHKEAIQKIPHGLQQTYHLLKMPLDSISSLSSQELLSSEPKQLKCSMCQFVAKWPAELQKHAVSHSEERPFVCMVCGSTYKWKWDLVKHFEKSHSSLQNPYKRREGGSLNQTNSGSPSTPPLESMSKSSSSLADSSGYMLDDETPPTKRRRMSDADMHDNEEFYRELLARQINLKREMGQADASPSMSDKMHTPSRPSSETSWQDSIELARDSGRQRMEEFLNAEGNGAMTPKMNVPVTEALKQRITSGKQFVEEDMSKNSTKTTKNGAEVVLPYKCSVCEYRARWPSEISQHMKNHSNEKPYHCPRCSYKSKWKWDVVKHLRRCGGGTVHDVIDTSKLRKMAPPNVMVMPQGNVQQQHHPVQHHQKLPSSQAVFPGGQRPSSLSPAQFQTTAAGNTNHTEGPNFSVAVGGQDHPEGYDQKQSQSGQLVAGQKHPVFRSLQNQGVFHCLECPFVGNSSAELRRHGVLHSENKPFMCTMCGYSSRWKCDLKKHMKTYGHFPANTQNQDSSDDAGESEERYIELNNSESDEENKSTLYMCPQCPYNSYKKMAYDMHLRIHGNMVGNEDESMVSESSPQSNESSAKFKCSKCEYHGNDLSSFLQHKRSHSNQISAGTTPTTSSRPNESPVPMETDYNTPTQPNEVSSRTLHLKHRRKPMKQFKCDKCPYVCIQRSSLNNHQVLHTPRGANAYLCMFCNYNVFSKSLLLQHMCLHPEYNPADSNKMEARVSSAELMELEEQEEKEVTGENGADASIAEENNNIDGYESGFEHPEGIIDFSKGGDTPYGGRSSTPVSTSSSEKASNSKHTPSNNNNNSIVNNNNNKKAGGLPCEWCSATFPNVVTLYHHAQSLHPLQLKAQEAGDIAAKQAPNRTTQLEKIVKERQREYQVYHQFMAQQQPQIQQQIQTHLQAQGQTPRRYVPLAPKPNQSQSQSQQSPQSQPSGGQNQPSSLDSLINLAQIQGQLSPTQVAALRARKSASQHQQKKSRSFQCTKCSFTAPNAVTYLRHIERHGSNCKHTCLFCDYSIDRLNLLYQHMKGTHGSKWTGTTEEKINLTVTGEDSNNNIIGDCTIIDDSLASEELNASFNSSHNDSMEGDFESRSPGDAGALSTLASKGIKPLLVLREETAWRGIKIQVCSLDGKKHYKCPKCFYMNNNAANTANHARQHGLNRKYKCHLCDYSVDNFKHIQHHSETIHPKEPNYTLAGGPQSSILIDDFPQEISTIGDFFPSPKAQVEKANVSNLSCPKCPYKTEDDTKLQNHLSRHCYNGKYECQLCDYSTDKYVFLKQHAKLHSRQLMAGVRNEQTTSDMGKSPQEGQETSMFENKDNKTMQYNETDDKIRFRCSSCPFYTLSKEMILQHRYHHISKKQYSCHLCSFSTDQTGQLVQHMHFHELAQTDTGDVSNDITLDPFDNSYKLIQQLPDDYDEPADAESDEKGDHGDTDEFGEALEEAEAMETENNELEDDVEMAMMEEELKDALGETGEATRKTGAEKNLESEGAFSEIQFRNYKCPDCPYSSNSNAEYRRHIGLHAGGSNLKFKCDYCTYSLDRLNLISQHRRLHFQAPGFDSTPLTSRLLNKTHPDYEATLEKIGNEIAFPPTESCAKDDDSDMGYLYQKGGSEFGDKVRYSCNKCPYKCQALKSFKCHIQMHGLIRKYKCDFCDWGADRLNLLYQHRKVHAAESGFRTNPGDIVFLNREYILDGETESNGSGVVGMAMMDYPSSPFMGEDLQQLPKRSSLGMKIHHCKICPFSSDNVNTYSYHKKLHCIQARYNCPECSYSINNYISLKDHIKLHKKERLMIKSTISESSTRHKCPKCPYSSPNKNLLVNHTSMHSSGRKYSCTHCDFSTDSQAILQLHTKVHDERYSDSDSLQEMELMLKHSPSVVGPQLYFTHSNLADMDSNSSDSTSQDLKCEQCPFSTLSKEEFGSHTQHHDTPNKKTCLFCSFSVSTEEELFQHAQVHFPTNTLDKETYKLLKKQNQSYRKNLGKGETESNTGDKVENKSDDGEPDSTVNETSKEESGEKGETTVEEKGRSETVKDSGKTKVYVCQYCEREFDCKTSMLQHEKQHLVGTPF